MFKRGISILLIFTVNVLFLTHNIIPHHHHRGIPHFTLFDSGHHQQHGDCCRHDGDNSCLLDKPIDAINEHHHCLLGCILHNPASSLLQAVLLTFTHDFSLVQDLFTVIDPPCLISYHCGYAASGLGLRAPPVV